MNNRPLAFEPKKLLELDLNPVGRSQATQSYISIANGPTPTAPMTTAKTIEERH
jgi:hypothetical protein